MENEDSFLTLANNLAGEKIYVENYIVLLFISLMQIIVLFWPFYSLS